MLLMVFWGSLGLILGARGAFLGGLLVFLRAFGGALHAQTYFWIPFLAKFIVLFRICFRSLLRSHCFPNLGASWCRF